ncbi:hypothetical protein [Methylobacterium pseudosasicola]|uniref:Large exoprotein involved in heme utilization or adhesion n=1 Tax=Methylobacterium pseudosasicola TaxID=582667 RepID=A0A1I4PBS0_9HYPH|nr:hypothetical protein [Methylobacterium pseudosasicola]SFM25201.1 hypothetical protein SAMN05192568_102410 [Methylobacterium pseudosasicola]
MSRNRFWCLIGAALILGYAIPAEAVPRGVPIPDRFDGTWSVEILTESGTCDRAYRYPVRIEHGQARFIGTAFVVQGSVTRNGVVRGSIASGIATANVAGRLGSNGFGTGTWVASGALECRGRWKAERRG